MLFYSKQSDIYLFIVLFFGITAAYEVVSHNGLFILLTVSKNCKWFLLKSEAVLMRVSQPPLFKEG